MLSFPPAHSQPGEAHSPAGSIHAWPWVEDGALGLPVRAEWKWDSPLFLEAVVPPRHSEGTGDLPVMAKGTLQGRGMWAGGAQTCAETPTTAPVAGIILSLA